MVPYSRAWIVIDIASFEALSSWGNPFTLDTVSCNDVCPEFFGSLQGCLNFGTYFCPNLSLWVKIWRPRIIFEKNLCFWTFIKKCILPRGPKIKFDLGSPLIGSVYAQSGLLVPPGALYFSPRKSVCPFIHSSILIYFGSGTTAALLPLFIYLSTKLYPLRPYSSVS